MTSTWNCKPPYRRTPKLEPSFEVLVVYESYGGPSQVAESEVDFV